MSSAPSAERDGFVRGVLADPGFSEPPHAPCDLSTKTHSRSKSMRHAECGSNRLEGGPKDQLSHFESRPKRPRQESNLVGNVVEFVDAKPRENQRRVKQRFP